MKNASVCIDQVGRLLIPKKIREELHLRAGMRMNMQVVGERIELSAEIADKSIVKKGKRRVIVGWEGFDALEALSDARAEQLCSKGAET